MAVRVFKNGFTAFVDSAAIASVVANIPGKADKEIEVDFINVTCDNSASNLEFYTSTSMRTTGANTAAGTSQIYLVGTTSVYTASDKIMIQKKSGVVEYTTVLSVGASHIIAGNNLTNVLVPGDEIHEIDQSGEISIGSNTKQIYGGVFLRAKKSSPLRFAISGGTTATIHCISGRYA